jgi:tetratricopeptide (TPR) repeat protein
MLNTLVIILLVALAVARPALAWTAPAKGGQWRGALLVVGSMVAAVFTGWLYYGYAAYAKSLAAAEKSDWAQAATWIDEAVRRDPANRQYIFQRGFTYGELALRPDGTLRDKAALDRALAIYASELNNEPNYALNWANLAILRRATEDRAGAIEALQKAVELAPKSAVLQLDLGRLFDEDGKMDQAVRVYANAIALDPDWKEAMFAKGSSAWESAVAQQQEKQVISDAGWKALAAGQYAEAERIFRARLAVNAADEYRGLGMALFGLGRTVEADQALAIAAYIDGGPLSARLALVDLYQRTGAVERAEAEYASALSLLDLYSPFGPGMWGGARYSWMIYRRQSVGIDLLPGWPTNHYPAPVRELNP